MKQIVVLLMVLFLLTCNGTALAADETDNRIEYQKYINCYSDNIIFINNNTGRSLLPLVFSSGETENELRVYRIYGDVLSATVKTKGTSRGIVWLQIILTAPKNMVYGDQTYKDFVTSGYHSYALLMGMNASSDPLVRYALVTAVNNGLSQNDLYEDRVGDYKLLCERKDNQVILTFGWREWEPQPAPIESPAEEDSDESDTESSVEIQMENAEG